MPQVSGGGVQVKPIYTSADAASVNAGTANWIEAGLPGSMYGPVNARAVSLKAGDIAGAVTSLKSDDGGRGARVAACNSSATTPDKEWSGPSLAHGYVGDGTPAACAAWCCAKSGCATWSLLLDPTCHLKAGQRCCMAWPAGRALQPCGGTRCVSGRVQRAPSPAPAPVATKLTLAPAAPPAAQFYHNLSLASWGANAVAHDGVWHSLLGVFYTDTQTTPASSCGLGSWNCKSLFLLLCTCLWSR